MGTAIEKKTVSSKVISQSNVPVIDSDAKMTVPVNPNAY
jgi:hypothetical protein